VVEEECHEPKAGEVRVRVLAIGVSLPDIMAREGCQRPSAQACLGARAFGAALEHVSVVKQPVERGTDVGPRPPRGLAQSSHGTIAQIQRLLAGIYRAQIMDPTRPPCLHAVKKN
jgi:NADPH:quinone reductase-like Zn-dependent oxidoreductase